MTSVVPLPLALTAARRAPSGTVVVHAGAPEAPGVLPALLGAHAERACSTRLRPGPTRAMRLALLARTARRTGMPALVVVHLTAGPSFARDSRLLSTARALGMHVVAHLTDRSLDAMLLRSDCLVTEAVLRADVVVVADAHAAALVRALLEGAPHAVAVIPLTA